MVPYMAPRVAQNHTGGFSKTLASLFSFRFLNTDMAHFSIELSVKGTGLLKNSRQETTTRRVDGIVITQYSHICFEVCNPSSPKLKNVVLKNDLCVKVSQSADIFIFFFLSFFVFLKRENCTDINAAGKNVMVRNAIAFMTLLSCWTIRLYACMS